MFYFQIVLLFHNPASAILSTILQNLNIELTNRVTICKIYITFVKITNVLLKENIP